MQLQLHLGNESVQWNLGSWLVKEAMSHMTPLMRSTKAVASQQRTTVDVQSLGSAGPVSFLPRQHGIWLWQWPNGSPSLSHYRDISSWEWKHTQLPVTWADELQWGESFFPSWSLTSLTPQLPWFTYLEKPSQLFNFGQGPREAKPFITEISNTSTPVWRTAQRDIRQMHWRRGRKAGRREFLHWPICGSRVSVR